MADSLSLVSRLRGRVRDLPRQVAYGPGARLMSELRKRRVILVHPHATIRFEGPVYLGPGFSLFIPDPGATFIVGPGVDFRRGFRAEISRGGTIRIGAGCVFSYYSLIQCSTSIEIGDRAMFGQSTMLVDGNHRFRDLDRPMVEQGYDYKPIRIEDDVTVMTKCTLVANIGTRAVVGAHSVVVRDVPPYCVVTGVPARVVDYFGPPGEEPAELAERRSAS
ncbi:MAG TPA: acyltransferase [Solirubrobacteraceae bacterium]|nr:acyltransferase [Solirubrobacteraceae bacterium]